MTEKPGNKRKALSLNLRAGMEKEPVLNVSLSYFLFECLPAVKTFIKV